MPSGLPGFRGALAVLEMEFEPAGSVTGAAAYQRGYQSLICWGWGTSSTAPLLAPSAEQFLNDLWSTAIQRLEEQARALGADGVVGVGVDQRAVGNGGWQLELTGTAIRAPGLDPPPRPFLS